MVFTPVESQQCEEAVNPANIIFCGPALYLHRKKGVFSQGHPGEKKVFLGHIGGRHSQIGKFTAAEGKGSAVPGEDSHEKVEEGTLAAS
jgi:hypothetical protein